MLIKKITIIILTVSLFSIQLYSQKLEGNDPIMYGTVIAAAVCEDGILLASDSRGVFILNKEYSNQVYAYIENDKKIFKIGDYLIANSGISMLNKKFIRDIVQDYNISHPLKEDIETTFNNFLNFLKTKENVPDSIIYNNDILIAGYENLKPKIIAQSKGKRILQEEIAHMTSSPSDLSRFLKPNPNIKLTCSNLAQEMENAIYALAEYRNDNKFGGPLELIQITPLNKQITLKTFKANIYKNYTDMANAILDGKIEVKYIFQFSEDLLKKTLREGIESGN